MSFQNFGTIANGDMLFGGSGGIGVTETYTGAAGGLLFSFLGAPGVVVDTSAAGSPGIGWAGFNALIRGGGVGSPASSLTININYSVDVSGPNAITGLQELFVEDTLLGAVSASATETVTDSSGNVVGVVSWSNGVSAPITLGMGYQHLNVSLVYNETVAAGASARLNIVGISSMAQGFTETPSASLASINSRVWLDGNADAVQQGGESGAAGVTVQLLNGAGTTVLATTTTDANGNYSFANLFAGNYETKVFAPSGELISTSNGGVDGGIALATGQTLSVAPTGLYSLASFSTHVYYDANANAAQDGGDNDLGGVTVSLLDGSGNPTGQTAVTDANGNVTFGGLLPGSYEVSVATPVGDAATQQTNVLTPVTLASGGSANAIEGVYAPASFTAHVYTDANANGAQDGGESALGGVTVALLDGSGNPTGQTAVTDANGNVTFGGLLPGSYEVSVTTPGGDGVTQQTNVLTPITLASGGSANAIEGVYAPASFTAHVYTDANANGAQDGGESSLGGVTVSLLDGSGNPTGQTAVTDVSGNVSFGGLVPGSYEIAVTTPDGDAVTQQSNVQTVNALTSGGSANAIEGVYAPASFTAHVYTDANANGAQEGGESSLAGVTVALLDGSGNPTGQTAVTDANGNVTFGGLVPGSYQVSVTTPGGDGVTQQTNVLTPVTLSSGGSANAIEGVYAPASFTAHVYTDANANGAQDGGESSLAGVTVALLDGAGHATGQTAVTDANGNVNFGGLVPGSYEVSVTTPLGDAVTQHTNVLTANTLASGGSANAIEGVYVPASFTAHVYTDANANSAQDGGEGSLAGVTVALLDGSGNPTGQTAVTDANGNVTFGGLVPGSYEVSVTAPAGDTVTQHSNVLTPVTLSSGGTANAIEGVFASASFTTHVYADANANSAQDGGESSLAGVTVTLLDGSGNPTGKSAATDANGNVTFGGLVPGAYEVSVTTPAGDVVTQHSNVLTVNTLTSGATANAIEGVYGPASFTAHVYTDANANSAQDGGDTNLAGVTVALLNGNGTPTGKTAVTDANGNVSFNGLVPGSYEVSVTAPAGDAVTQHSNVLTPITLTSGGTANAIEGVYAPASFTTHVYTDANANSAQDGGETSLAGVTVALLNGNGTPTGKSAVTDANGNVSFSGLVPGSYEVSVTAPAGDAVTQHSNVLTPVTLASGGTANAIEGVYAPASFTTHVYTDANANSAQDGGETSLSGVTVTLLNGAGQSTGKTAVTDANGNVSFSGLVPGSYEVAVTTPAGDTVTQHTNVQTVNTLTSGGTANAIEGVYAPASFTTHVYTDANANGIQDSGETNLAGVTVTLLNGAGQSTGKTAVSDANGNVSFSGLVPGGYEVAVTTPAGDAVTQHTNVQTVNTLSSGGTASAIEGVYAPASFTTHVYYDANSNSVQDGSDTNLSGVTVSLLNGTGTPTGQTAVTDSSGNVSFSGLVPGSYEVAVTTPSGDVVTQHSNVLTPVTLSSGQTASAVEGVHAATTSGISVIKLPGQVVVGSCGQVTYTYKVTDTGTTPVSNIKISDNIGTAAHPYLVTPAAVTSGGYNVGDGNHNNVLDPGETWQYANTINESGNPTGKGGTSSHTVSGSNLGSGCTAWLNSSFTPTSCKDGATYTFQNITCTISGSGGANTTLQVPNAVVTFSKSCTQATTTYDSTQNCWVTTLPAGSTPGNVFLSGLPFQVPTGSNLSGATISWNIGQSGNNCGSSGVSWQTGCTGYSSFSQNGCDGQDDYNQIGVKACDNSSGYGNGGSTGSGYGWNYGDSGAYCGGSNGGWSSGWNSWNVSSNDNAGTPENQYTSGSTGYCGFGNNFWGYGSNPSGGTCGNGGSSSTCVQSQLGNSAQADTVTVTATTLGGGFSLGDAANYGIIAFSPSKFVGSSNSPINGSVGLGAFCSTATVQLANDKITGNLVTTGTKPSSTGGTVTGTTSGNSSTLAADINALQSLSGTLGSETGTSVAFTSGKIISASSGTLDSAGNYVFTVTSWANNITINGDGTHNVVFNIANNVVPVLDNVTLTGGLTANDVLFNDVDGDTIKGTSGTTFNGTFLAPNATFNVSGVTVNGHLYGGTNGQAFSFTSGAVLNAPSASTGVGAPAVTTVSATDSKEVQVLASNSSISLNGTTPTGSLSALYGTGQVLEFGYNPSDTVSLKQIQAGLGTVSGHNANQMAFIEISNNSNPFATGASVYFQGSVVAGEKIFADSTLNQLTNTPVAAPNNHFSTTAGADIFAFVFNSQADFQNHAAPVQTIAYNTSGSQAMHFGDQIGSLSVIGYVGGSGGHLVS